jgi:hypothetical protein
MSDQIQLDAAIRRAPVLDAAKSSRRAGTPGEVFAAFFNLGCTAFGGPIAHLGYFQNEFVIRRKWMIDGEAYADLVALCQFLPGPASSQVAALRSAGNERDGRGRWLRGWRSRHPPPS